MKMTLFEEMISAGRGVFALLLGRRNAPSYFDLTVRGLTGSFAVFIFATTLNAYVPYLLGMETTDMRPWQTLMMVGTLYLLQVGFSALVLNQLKRLDGLIPYLVADNWATFFITIISIILGVSGIGGDFALLGIGIVVIIVEINIARLIVTLTPLQIAMFLIAQLVGVMIGLMVIGMALPTPVGV